jgi:hypothetical protein
MPPERADLTLTYLRTVTALPEPIAAVSTFANVYARFPAKFRDRVRKL